MSLMGNAAKVLVAGSKWAKIAEEKGGFWGEYSKLNAAIGIDEIRAKQESALRQLLISTYKDFNKKGGKYKALYDFLFSNKGKNGRFKNIEDNAQNEAINKAIHDTFANIRSIRGIQNKKEYSQDQKYTYIKDKLENVVAGIQKFSANLTQDQSTGELAISGTYIDELLNLFKWKDMITVEDIEEMLKNLNNLQGEILEEMATAFFNSRIPRDCDIKAVSVGQTSGPGGQFVSDILMVNLGAVKTAMKNLDKIIIEYTLQDENGNSKKHREYLSQFIKTLESYSGRKQIQLDDENYGKLLDFSLGGIQAKSGLKQAPWNKSKKHTVALNELVEGPRTMLGQFVDLYNKQPSMIKNDHSLYQSVGNLGLADAKILAKLLDIDQSDSSKGNLMLATQEGFVPYNYRLLQLLDEKGTDQALMFRFSTIYLSGGMSAAYNVKAALDK